MALKLFIVFLCANLVFAQSPPLTNSIVFNVREFGAKGDGSTDDTAAFRAAAAASSAVHGTLFMPSGQYYLTGTVTVTAGDITGAGQQASVILFPTALAAGNAVFAVSNTYGTVRQTISNFSIIGPGNSSYTAGVDAGVMDGIQAGNMTPYFEKVTISGFRNAEVLFGAGGHAYNVGVTLTRNYYGIYVRINHSDYYVIDSDLTGNTMASIATPSDQGFDSMHLIATHMCFSPYGIYQEATPANQGAKAFLTDVEIDHGRFEQCGNAAIFSAAQFDSSDKNAVNNLQIRQPGFTWDYSTGSPYTLVSAKRSYPVQLSLVLGNNVIDPGFVAPPTFAINTAYVLGAIITDSNGNMQQCSTAGTSGGSAPTWNTVTNGTTTTGSAVFTNKGTAGGYGIFNVAQLANNAAMTIKDAIAFSSVNFGLVSGGIITLGKDGNQVTYTDAGAQVPLSYQSLWSTGNCNTTAQPAICTGDATGIVAVPATVTDLIVEPGSIITAASRIFFSQNDAATGLGTCDTSFFILKEGSTRVPGTGFHLLLDHAPASGKVACIQYTVFN